jgi:hypothetical protein
MLGDDAVMVVAPLAVPGLTGKLAVPAPASTVTVAGTVPAVVLLLVRLIAAPFGPAGAERFTVMFAADPPSARGFGVNVIMIGTKLTVAVPESIPIAEAVMVVVPPMVPGVTGTLAVLAPEATVMVAGTVATVVLLLVKVTDTPDDPAGTERVNVRVAGYELKANGFGASVIDGGAGTVMVTVDGALLV